MKKLIIPLLALLCLSTCSTNSLHLKDLSNNAEVQPRTSMTFNFDKDLAPPEKQDNWVTDEFVKFEPAIPGRYKWIDSRTLVFSPDIVLPSSTDYKAKVTSKALFETKFSNDCGELKFHTPYFSLVSEEIYWTPIQHSDYEVSPQVTLNFNEPVQPSMLNKYLEVTLNGEPLKQWDVITKESATQITINFGKAQQKSKEQDIKIVLKKGLPSVYNRRPIMEDIEKKFTLAPSTELRITGITTGFNGDAGWIDVATSQTVDRDFIEKHLTLDPKIKYEIASVEAQSFRLEGAFIAGGNLNVKISKGLPGLYGGTLQDDFEQEVTFADIDPFVHFTDKGGKYMMLSGLKNLELESINLKEVNITVSEVFQNNIVQFLNGNSSYNYYNEEEGDYGNNVNVSSDVGKQLYEEKIKVESKMNSKKNFTINLEKALGQRYKGIFVVSAASNTDRWRSDNKVVIISDLGMICKMSGEDMIVFVNSIASAEPVADVDVKLFSRSNQVLAEGKTNAEGILKISGMKEKIEDFVPKMILAEKGNDFNVIDLNETSVETSRFPVDGQAESAHGLTAFLYSERNLFRPGEDMHLSAIVRTNTYQNVKGEPMLVKLQGPTGGTIQEWKKNTDAQGGFELTYNIPSFARTGIYNFEVSNGAGKGVNSYSFHVEEFAPDKIRVQLSQPKDKYKPGETATVDVNSQYLFGAPVANQRFEDYIHFTQREYNSKRYPEYEFGNYSGTNTKIESSFTESALDANGKGKVTYVIPETVQSGGYIEASCYVSVFDVTGRSVSKGVDFNIYSKDDFIGIKQNGYYHGVNQDIDFDLAVVDKNDKGINGYAAEAELVRYEWHSVLRGNSSGRYYYVSEKKEFKEWKKDIVINSQSRFSFRTGHAGDFELRIHKKGSDEYVKTGFYTWDYSSNTTTNFSVNKEGNIEMSTDKKTYQPGEKAKVLFTTPFSGKMLVTVERKNVYTYQYVDVKNNTAELLVPITEDYLPNVYISATLFKKHAGTSAIPFLVGHGYASIMVEKPENKIPVKIIAPAKVKPGPMQTIVIKTLPGKSVHVTLAAVDEGVLQIKNYATPDPYSFMYAKRQLNVNSYDLYKFLLPEVATMSSTTGAGEGFEISAKRSNPIQSTRFKLFSYWSGILVSDASGTVKVNLPVPQFTGDVRLMAVAYVDKQFGSAEEHMIVTDDVLLMPAIPRFLSQNDALNIPMTVMNTTSKEGNVNIEMKLSGPMTATTALTQSVSLKANESKVVNFGLKTGVDVGKGTILFTATGMDNVKDETEISIRPNSPFVKESGAGTIQAGQNINIPLPKDFLASTQNASVKVSKFQALQYAKQMQFLVGYPYGCLEQTVSKLFPQLYFNDLVAVAAPGMFKGNNSVYYIKQGIRKIEGMVIYDGAIAYWEGGNYPNFWSNVYAAHFLLEAKKAGYDVNKEKLDNLLSYIRRNVSSKKLEEYRTFRSNTWEVHQIAPKEYIYGLYVLALAGQGDMSLMNYYNSKQDNLSRDERYVLAGAFALMNRRNVYNQLLPKSYDPEIVHRCSGDNFDSEIRSNAMMLDILLTVDPENAQIPSIVKFLSKKVGGYGTTQEMAWAVLALGKAAKSIGDSKVNVQIISGGQTVANYASSDGSKNFTLPKGNSVSLIASGTGQAYYFWDIEGVKLGNAPKNEDANIRVRRTYYDRFGVPIANNTLKQGQLVVCKISIDCPTQSVDNVAISDLIPAGCEIMNPRLGNLTELTWIPSERMSPEYMDIKDDRILLFTHIPSGKVQHFYYMMRATNQGDYQLAPIGAEAMYDPEFHSYNGGGKIKILAGTGGM